MTEADQSEMLAKAGVGAFMAASVDGSLGSVDPDAMSEMAAAMAGNPRATARLLGNDEVLGDTISPDGLYDNIMSQYLGARFADAFVADMDEADAEAEAARTRLSETAFTYSRLSPEEIGRIQFDAENGDMSAMLKVEERFYLG